MSLNINTLVSIIIPYFNCYKYIEEVLNSAFNQSHTLVEIIIVNDGSDDKNTAFLENLLKEYPNVIYRHQNNQGVSSARNTGANIATGEFLVFLDADDKLAPTYIEKTLAYLLTHPDCKVVYSRAELFDGDTGEWQLPEYIDFRDLLIANKILTSALHRRADFLRIGGFDATLATYEDWDYWIRLLKDGGSVKRLDEILLYHRKRTDHSSLTDDLLSNATKNRTAWQKVCQKHSDVYISYHLSYLDFFEKLMELTQQEHTINKYHTLEQKLNTCNQQLTQDNQQLTQDNQQLTQDNQQLTQDNQQLTQDNQQLTQDNQQLTQDNQQLTQDNQQLTQDNQQLTQDNQQLTQDNQQLTQDNQQLTQDNQQLTQDNQQLTQDNQQLTHSKYILIEYNHALETKLHQFKRLWLIKLLKPFIKLEQGLHSLNRYRKQFRKLSKHMGGFDNAHQHLSHLYHKEGFKTTKNFLKHYDPNIQEQASLDNKPAREFTLDDDIIILCTRHTHYIGKLLQNALSRINVHSDVVFDEPTTGYDDKWHIVVCPQIFKTLPAHYIAFQMEQSVSSRWFNDDYFNRLNNAKYVFDYSLKNIEFLQANGLPFSNLFYLPIGLLQDDSNSQTSTFEYDVAFYGDPNCERRQRFLTQLQEHFSVKVISEVFGDELYELLKKCKIIVNIHYYENALLETTRLYECLHLNKVVVSEKSSDQDEHADLEHLIDFVEIDDVGAMVDKIKTLLAHPNHINERIQSIKKHKAQTDKFQFYFYRFLLAHDLLEFDKFYELVADYVKPKGDFWCLSLPESTQRRADFNKDNHHNIWVFDGLRHHIGWIGCGLSYKFMLKLADQLKLPSVAICEDDVLFYDDFDKRYHNIKSDLANNPDDWDIFSGLIADLSKDIKLSHTAISSGQENYYQINKLVSMVFNVYNHSIYRKLWQWDYHHRNTSNTIDRYLENSGNIKGIITDKFLVGHKEELSSTLWGFQNTQYSTMIAESQTLLTQKINDLNNKEEQ